MRAFALDQVPALSLLVAWFEASYLIGLSLNHKIYKWE